MKLPLGINSKDLLYWRQQQHTAASVFLHRRLRLRLRPARRGAAIAAAAAADARDKTIRPSADPSGGKRLAEECGSGSLRVKPDTAPLTDTHRLPTAAAAAAAAAATVAATMLPLLVRLRTWCQ